MYSADNRIDRLSDIASKIRRATVTAIYMGRSGHPGGSLSCADILAVIFSNKIGQIAQDHFILSKGHASPALYATAAEFGIISYKELLSFRKLNSALQGHPHVGSTPWVETSTGSLGQGFSVAIGVAMGDRYQKQSNNTYVLLGDGELQEGEVWEGAMCAAHYKLDNLCAIVDYNKMQSDDLNVNVMNLEPLRAKWEAFNWHVIEINGHDFRQIESAFGEARVTKDKPTVIIAHTIKGKGVSYMEGMPAWHGSVTLRQEELERALQDLGAPPDDIPAYIDGSIWSK
jgi:transketolase